jgi:uncharacterized integral membrane protein (TIGR00698 family)
MSKPRFRSKLLTSEDYWAIWLASFFLAVGILVYLVIGQNQIGNEVVSLKRALDGQSGRKSEKPIEWHITKEKYDDLTGSNTIYGKQIKSIFGRLKSWKGNPLDAFYSPEHMPTDQELEAISTLEGEIRDLEAAGENKISQTTSLWLEKKAELNTLKKKAYDRGFSVFPGLLKLGLLLALIFGVGTWFMGQRYYRFVIAFLGVFVLAVLSYFLAAQSDMKDLGVSYAVWAIVIGMAISNTIRTPEWLKPAVQTEYYIKTGRVLLGAEILLNKIMAIGLPGIFVAWVVTPIVLVLTYWFGQKVLKIGSKTLNITISADMSVCGVSAAIATAAACNARKEELTLAVGLSMVFTSVMMIVMPAFINAVGMPEVLGGAWIGGTIDATGAVVAAGAFLGDKALNVAATIKMIQNILIGLIAFGVAVYWSTNIDKSQTSGVGISEIWKRFPKFILGFFGASVLFSVIYATYPQAISSALIDHGILGGFTKDLRGWLFCLAFVSIGLSVNFKELRHQFSGGKPLILYVCGQLLNLILTLIMAYVMFYIVFPEITELI